VSFYAGALQVPPQPAALVNKSFRVSFYGLQISSCTALIATIASQTGPAAPIGVGSWFTSPKGVGYGASNYDSLPLMKNGVPIAFTGAEANRLCAGAVGDASTNGSVSAEFDFLIH
jgi:hypothetical protein